MTCKKLPCNVTHVKQDKEQQHYYKWTTCKVSLEIDVYYTIKIHTNTEEPLATVFACVRSDQCIHGRDKINGHSDHN
jgi:hypothetical protein